MDRTLTLQAQTTCTHYHDRAIPISITYNGSSWSSSRIREKNECVRVAGRKEGESDTLVFIPFKSTSSHSVSQNSLEKGSLF